MFKLVVLSCLVAVACGSVVSPYAPLAYTAGLYSPYVAGLYSPYNSNYRGPLSLAPGQPANIIAADGRPLDTLDVNLDRSAHLTRKAYETAGIHLLKKRSAPLIAAPLTHYGLSAASLYASPLTYATPYAAHYAAPYAPLAHYTYTAPIAHAVLK